MNTHDEYREALSALLDGELSDAERSGVLAHLETCEQCRTYLAELTALREAFAGMEDADVPAGFAAGVMARLREESAPRSAWAAKAPKRRTRRGRAALAACVALVLFAGSTAWRFTHLGGASKLDNSAPASGGPADTNGAAPPVHFNTAAGSAEAYDEVNEYAVTSGYDLPPADGGEPEAALQSSSAAEPGDGLPAENGAQNEYAALDHERSGDAADAPDGGAGAEHIGLWLYGEGAAEYLLANGAEPGEFDGEYLVDASALRALPEGLTLGGAQAGLAAEPGGVTVLVHVGGTEAAP